MSSRTKPPPASETLLRAARWTATPAGLLALFAGGLVLRLLLARGGGFPGDIGIFQSWAARLADVGPGGFYSPDYFADYPPGYLYVLWPLGELARVMFDGTLPVFLVKLPGMLADIGLAYVVMRLASLVATASGNDRWWIRPAAASAILFNPPVVFLSAVWGQVDSVAALYALGGILVLAPANASLRREAGGAALLALAFATKPQMAFLLPVVALVLVLRHVRGRSFEAGRVALRLGVPLASFAATWIALGIPFGLSPSGLVSFYADAGSTYPVTSVWAFNFWALPDFWRPDSGAGGFRLFGLPAVAVGMIAFGAAAVYALLRVYRAVAERRPDVEVMLAGGAAVVCISFALLTRIHERYLFLGLACLAPLIVYPRVRAVFGGIALLYMVNLFFPWVYYNDLEGRETTKIGWLYDLLYGSTDHSAQKKLLGLVTGIVCVAVALRIWDLLKPGERKPSAAPAPAGDGRWRLGLHPIGKRGAALAGIVFLVVVPTRLVGLESPQGMYFDEIYHARTAGEYIQGEESYEYTHPPLGKELMALSLKAFSGWGVERGGDAPAGLDAGVVDSDGTTVAWATPSPTGDGAVLWTAPLTGGCAVDAIGAGTPIDLEPSAISVASTGGAFVAGLAGDRPVVERYSGEVRVWDAGLDSPAVDVAGAGDVAFVVDEAGRLLRADAAGVTELATGAASVASDPDLTGVWVAFPESRIVAAYDLQGTQVAVPNTFESPDEVVVVADADRVLALDGDSGWVESIDNQAKVWTDRLRTTAQSLAAMPEKGLAYAIDGRRVDVLEPRGLTVIGEATLPSEPRALVPVRDDGALIAVGDDGLSCVAGDNTFAWRLPGALLGALVPALVFLLALRCTGSRGVAVLSAAFMALDGLGFAMSRIATLDSQATAHITASWLGAASVLFHARSLGNGGDSGSKRLGRVWLVATGVFLGLAIATKWVGVYSFLLIALLMLVDLIVRRERGIGGLFPRAGAAFAAVGGAVLVLPLGIYVLSYLPYFSLGHGFGDLLQLQKAMYDYHAKLTATHPYSSSWYSWPFGHKAVAMWSGSSGTESGVISAIANPVVFVGGLWGVAVVAIAAWRRRIVALALLPLAALTQYLPWTIVSRAAFLYHYLPVVPFLAIALAWALAGRPGRSKARIYETGLVVAAAAIVFAVTLPELDGWYVSQGFHDSLHNWFGWLF
jgi:predicted membrane-bound dolichyl-phosphate-mannose-protein mannosyltransferase